MYKNRISEAGDRAELEDAIENIWDNLVPESIFCITKCIQETDQSYVMENYGGEDFFTPEIYRV